MGTERNKNRKSTSPLTFLNPGLFSSSSKIEHTSLDCYDCTAYVEHSADRVAWMKEAYPAYYEKYAANMCALKSVLMPMLKNLERYDV